jgi:hypothetical protein
VTHTNNRLASAICYCVCICLTFVPQLAGWYEDVSYYCSHCNHRVAFLPYDGPIQTFSPVWQPQPVAMPPNPK